VTRPVANQVRRTDVEAWLQVVRWPIKREPSTTQPAAVVDMNWLTPEIADKLGIYFEYDKTFPPKPPHYDYSPPTPEPEPPATAAKFHWRVIQNLNLRVSPDPRSGNALSQWSPDDYIPEGITFYGNSLPRCVPGPTGYIWCEITFQHHRTSTHGWVAGYYLWSLEGNRRVACLYPNPDPDCDRK
jgi:hypothetical protein